MALLDINTSEFFDKVRALSDEEVAKLDDSAVGEYGAQYFMHLEEAHMHHEAHQTLDGDAKWAKTVEELNAVQVAYQAVASMSDATLHELVKRFGNEPELSDPESNPESDTE